MFGIGFWEMLMISGLVLIAVGPERLPAMIKSTAKLYRQMRRAALDIRQSTGIDDVLRDEELKEIANLRNQKIQLMDAARGKPSMSGKPTAPVGKPAAPEGVVAKGSLDKPAADPALQKPAFEKPMAVYDKSAALGKPVAPAVGTAQRPESLRGLSLDERRRELPLEGVDVATLRARLTPGSTSSVSLATSAVPVTHDGRESAA